MALSCFLASNNAGKAREFAALAALSGAPLSILSASAVGGMPSLVEDAGSFLGNARLKARALRVRVPAGAAVLADDSGLCVEALGGAPGADSAAYAGIGASDTENLAKLAAALRDAPEARRAAEFVCVLVLIAPDGSEISAEGRCPGRLRREPRGSAGFGYDPLFVPEGSRLAFAEMTPEAKNALSHRARAWEALAKRLREAGPSPFRQPTE